MREFKNDQEKLTFMFPIISRYRIFLMKYLDISKTELLEELGNRMNVPADKLHLKHIKQLNQANDIIEALKVWKAELTGSRRLPEKGNMRDYAKKLKGQFKMKVVEIFNSIDGEGIRTGELTTFIRLWGCNLRCGYCDTRYSYCQDNAETIPYKEMAIEEIIKECDKYDTDNITLTGGEPLIHLDVKYLLKALSEAGYNVNVETNGSVPIKSYYNTNGYQEVGYENVFFTVDYKSLSSTMNDKMYIDNFDVRKNKWHNVVYKFVVGSKEDLLKAKEIIENYILTEDDNENVIYFSPIFGDIEPKEIVEFMQEHKLFNSKTPIRCQLQLHKFIWPVDQRGV